MERRERLADRVRARRRALRISISEAARRGEMDRATWTGAEKALRETRDEHYAGIEAALGWAPSSVERILAGGEPLIGDVVEQEDVLPDYPELPLYDQIRNDPNLRHSPEQREAVIRRMKELEYELYQEEPESQPVDDNERHRRGA